MSRSHSLLKTAKTTTRASFGDYIELCKPRVVALMVLTSIVGMCLATPGLIPWKIFVFGNLGIALAAGAAAAVNHVADQHIDSIMARTQNRPLPTGKLSSLGVGIFAIVLCVISMLLLVTFVNVLTAILTILSLVAYAGVYTYYLKHATSQNIVIGGLAGASPPLLGWVAVTGQIQAPALALVLIIFLWTPPHFWALAIARVEEYAKANIPMLPNTHGIPSTKRHIIVYTFLLFAATLLPCALKSSGWIYAVAVIALNLRFLQWTYKLKNSDSKEIAMKTFRYSIVYLMYLFVALLIDHYCFYHANWRLILSLFGA